MIKKIILVSLTMLILTGCLGRGEQAALNERAAVISSEISYLENRLQFTSDPSERLAIQNNLSILTDELKETEEAIQGIKDARVGLFGGLLAGTVALLTGGGAVSGIRKYLTTYRAFSEVVLGVKEILGSTTITDEAKVEILRTLEENESAITEVLVKKVLSK